DPVPGPLLGSLTFVRRAETPELPPDLGWTAAVVHGQLHAGGGDSLARLAARADRPARARARARRARPHRADSAVFARQRRCRRRVQPASPDAGDAVDHGGAR